jgi:alcohol dehydrogenase class IV
MDLRKFVIPEFVFGVGARFLAGRYVINSGAHKVLVVTDPGVIAAGWVNPILDHLEKDGLAYSVYSDVHSNPRDEEVMAGATIYQRERCNAIIAIGGGSPMDCAKGIGIVSSNHRNILKFEGVDEVSNPGPPLICIPTTAGSSADVSQFAIINDTKRQVKIAIVSKSVVPDSALIDPETTLSMDPFLTACTGLDALTHAFEAFASNAHGYVTDLHALEAIRLVWRYLPIVITEPDNMEARTQMMLASMYAGLAFSNASLGAVHAMAHSLGGFMDLPHGECNALLLEHVVAYNYDAAPERYQRIGEALCLFQWNETADTKKNLLVNAIHTFRSSLGIAHGLSAVGVSIENIRQLAEKAINDPCIVTNPKPLNIEDLVKIYGAAL